MRIQTPNVDGCTAFRECLLKPQSSMYGAHKSPKAPMKARLSFLEFTLVETNKQCQGCM